MKWILLIAWAANGTGYTSAEFATLKACQSAKEWVQQNNRRGGTIYTACINKIDGESQ